MRRVLASQTSANRRNGSLVLMTSVAKYYRSTTIWQYVKTKLISCPINLINSNLCTFQSDRKCWKITVTSFFVATIITLDYTITCNYFPLYTATHHYTRSHSITHRFCAQILFRLTKCFTKIFLTQCLLCSLTMWLDGWTGWLKSTTVSLFFNGSCLGFENAS